MVGSGLPGPITVSTLAEAEYFGGRAGWTDILYATAMAPAKIARAARLQRQYAMRLTLVVDNPAAATLLGQAAAIEKAVFGVLVEVDCGEHRSGVAPASVELTAVAASIADAAAAPPARGRDEPCRPLIRIAGSARPGGAGRGRAPGRGVVGDAAAQPGPCIARGQHRLDGPLSCLPSISTG